MGFESEDKTTATNTRATIGVSVAVKGEISGDEDILIEGSVEGSINLRKNAVVVAKTGKVKANISGVTIHVEGEVTGDLLGAEQVIVHRSGRVRGNVTAPRICIEDGAKVFDHAVIQGPAYIGKNCIVTNNSLVRESHLGAGCVAGYSTEIARSFLADGVWTHTNYVGDSVIGRNSSFGSGTVTGNLRLDEKEIPVSVGSGESATKVNSGTNKLGSIVGENVRVGINVSLMPGVKIGNNSFIGAGITVWQDVPDSMFVYGKWELTMKPNTARISPSAREEMMQRLKKS